MKYVLYNPLSGNGGSKEIAESLGRLYGEDMSLLDITAIEDIASFGLGLSTGSSISLIQMLLHAGYFIFPQEREMILQPI